MGEWLDVILAIVALIQTYPLAGWTLVIMLAAGSLMAFRMRRSRRDLLTAKLH